MLSFPDKPDLKVNITDSTKNQRNCEVWGDGCVGLDLGDAASHWLSEVILGKADGGLRLVHHNQDTSSRSDIQGNASLRPLCKNIDKPYYADGSPYLLLSTASIQDLNKNLKDHGETLQVEETRFRPNIVVHGDFEGFAED